MDGTLNLPVSLLGVLKKPQIFSKKPQMHIGNLANLYENSFLGISVEDMACFDISYAILKNILN